MLGVEALSGVLGIGMRPEDSTAGYRRYVKKLAELGVAVLLVAPGSKLPDDVRTDRKRKDDQRRWERIRAALLPHGMILSEEAPSGLHLATKDPREIQARVAAYRKRYGENTPVNIGIEAARSNLLLVDVDTMAELQAFRATWLHHAHQDPANNYPVDSIAGMGPTVRSPGKRNPDGTWAHRDGGHWYFRVPDNWNIHMPLSDEVNAALEEVDVLPGSDLYETIKLMADPSVGQLTVSGHDVPTTFDGVSPGPSGFAVPGHHEHTAGWTVFWRNHYVLAPPSVRAEGVYEARNDCLPAPGWLLHAVWGEIERSKLIAADRKERNDERAARRAKKAAKEAADAAVPVPDRNAPAQPGQTPGAEVPADDEYVPPSEPPDDTPGPSPYGMGPIAAASPSVRPSDTTTFINVLEWVKAHPREITEDSVTDTNVVYTGIDLEHGSEEAKAAAKTKALRDLEQKEAAGVLDETGDDEDDPENLYDEFAFDDALIDWYQSTSWDDILVPYGWFRSGTDRCGCGIWARPGADRGTDKSATAHEIGCTDAHYFGSEDPPMHFWTTNPGPEIADMIADRGTRGTLSKMQVYAALRHGGDFSAASKDTGMPVWRLQSDWGASRLWSKNLAPASVNPYDEWLEGVLFETSPILRHIRDRAREAGISPWSALMIAVATAAYYIPPNVMIPAIIGKPASLNQIISVVAASGGGKGISFGKDIIQFREPDNYYGTSMTPPARMSVGSGEALSALYVRWENVPHDEVVDGAEPSVSKNGHEVIATSGGDEAGRANNKRLVQHQKANWVDFPEVDKIVSIATRKGSTLDPELRLLWSGEGLGTVTKTNSMHVPDNSYRGVVTISVQPRRAAGLFADDAGGLLQRIVWCSANDPNIRDAKDIVEPGRRGAPMTVDLPRFSGTGDVMFGMDSRVVDEVVAAHVFLQRAIDPRLENPPEIDPLDTHRNLARLKIAVSVAALHGRARVEYDDWLWAGYLMQHSSALRELVRKTIRSENSKALRGAAVAEAQRQVIVDETRDKAFNEKEEAAYTGTVEWVRRWFLENNGKVMTKSTITSSVGSRSLRRVSADAFISRMVSEGMLTTTSSDVSDTWDRVPLGPGPNLFNGGDGEGGPPRPSPKIVLG